MPPTTSATSQNTSGPNSKQLLFRSSYRLNALEGFRGPILWTWEPLPCPLWPPQHPPHRRTPRGQIPNNFYFDLLTVWTPWKASGGYLMYLGAPPLPPVAPTTSATSQNTSGPNSKQVLFRSSYRLSSLEGYRENILFSGGPPPPFAPLWGTGEGV